MRCSPSSDKFSTDHVTSSSPTVGHAERSATSTSNFLHRASPACRVKTSKRLGCRQQPRFTNRCRCCRIRVRSRSTCSSWGRDSSNKFRRMFPALSIPCNPAEGDQRICGNPVLPPKQYQNDDHEFLSLKNKPATYGPTRRRKSLTAQSGACGREKASRPGSAAQGASRSSAGGECGHNYEHKL